MKTAQTFHWLLLFCVLIGLAGYLSGRLVSAYSVDAVPFVIREDTRPAFPTVIIKGVYDGHLVGTVLGDVRFFVGDDLVQTQSGAGFRVSAGVLKTDVRTIVAPSWASFVASKRGTKYYPVHSSQAQGLSPENRVYFRTVEEAEKAGYRK